MKELFKRFADFLFNNRFVSQNVSPKPDLDAIKTDPDAIKTTDENVPPAKDAPKQVDQDVAGAMEQGDDLSIPPLFGSEKEAEQMRADRLATLSPEEQKEHQPKTGDVEIATKDEITTAGVVGDAGKARGEKSPEVIPVEPERTPVEVDEKFAEAVATKRGERDSVQKTMLAEARGEVEKGAEGLGEKVDLAELTSEEAAKQEAERVAATAPRQPRGIEDIAQPMEAEEMGTEGVVGDAGKIEEGKKEVKLEEEEK